MIKFKLKSGDTVKVICGKYCNTVDKIKKIDKKRHLVYLEKASHQQFVKKTNAESESKVREVFVPIDISNVELWEEKK